MSDPTPVPVLAYANPADQTPRPTPLALRLCFLAASCCAAVALFTPFAWDTSPLGVLSSFNPSLAELNLSLIAIPFFAGPVAALLNLRRLRLTRLRPFERTVLYLVALPAIAATFVLACRSVIDEDISASEAFQILTGPALIGLAIGLVAWLTYRRRHAAAAVTALYAGFAGNAVTCLVMFRDSHPEIGWILTLAAVIGMGTETVMMGVNVLRQPRHV
jgi:hypothetical protein